MSIFEGENIAGMSDLMFIELVIGKLELIPKGEWCTHSYEDKAGCKCVMGHCGATYNNPMPRGASRLIGFRFGKGNIIYINDFNDERDPKERTISALRNKRAELMAVKNQV